MSNEATKTEGRSFTFSELQGHRAPFHQLIHAAKIGRKGAEKGDPKFGLTLLLPEDHIDLKNLKAAMATIARETWPGRDLKELKFPLESGAKAKATAQANGKDGVMYDGMVVFRATSGEDRPVSLAVREGGKIVELMGAQREIVGKQKFYWGCYVSASVWLSAYKKGSEGGIGEFSGIKAYLTSVCWLRDGPRIGGTNVAETFKAYAGTVSAESATEGADDEITF